MTRCTAGDTAYFRKGPVENLNLFVSVVSPCNPGLARIKLWSDDGAWWLVEARRPIIHPCGHAHGKKAGDVYRDFVPDDLLTPVRDREGDDETLAWRPVPSTEEVT
jgi:hypothetical protein